jgi:hypothetical protein
MEMKRERQEAVLTQPLPPAAPSERRDWSAQQADDFFNRPECVVSRRGISQSSFATAAAAYGCGHVGATI